MKMRLLVKHETGNAYIEYFVVASVVLLATLAFYNTYLRGEGYEGYPVRFSVDRAFYHLCRAMTDANCDPYSF